MGKWWREGRAYQNDFQENILFSFLQEKPNALLGIESQGAYARSEEPFFIVVYRKIS